MPAPSGLPAVSTCWIAFAWSFTPWQNERTTASLCARAASAGNVPPKVTPGIVVATSPVTLRTPSGASIRGSNVSIWLAPPARNSTTTALSLSASPIPASAAVARVRSSSGSASPPSASDPIRRKSRRRSPPQSRPEPPVKSVSIPGLHGRTGRLTSIRSPLPGYRLSAPLSMALTPGGRAAFQPAWSRLAISRRVSAYEGSSATLFVSQGFFSRSNSAGFSPLRYSR